MLKKKSEPGFQEEADTIEDQLKLGNVKISSSILVGETRKESKGKGRFSEAVNSAPR